MNLFFEGLTLGNQSILSTACLLPLYPGLIAFLAGNTENELTRRATAWLGLLVLAGILTMMMAIALLIYLVKGTSDDTLPIVLPIAYGLVIVFGVMMFVGRNPFARMQTLQAPLMRNPYATAYVYGLLFGPMAFPCIGPFLVSAFAIGAANSSLLADNLIYFLGFGLGFGWPLIVLPLLALPIQRRIISWLTTNHTLMERTSGILLIGVGIFGVLTELLPHYYAAMPEFSNTTNYVYWLAVIALVVAVGFVTYRYHPNFEKNEQNSN